MSELLRYRSLWIGSGIAMLVVVMILALWPLPQGPDPFPYSDKIIHAVVFAFLMIWFAGISAPSAYRMIFLLLAMYGIAMEAVQSFTPDRFMSVGDFAADLVGLGVGWLAALAGASRWSGWIETRLP